MTASRPPQVAFSAGEISPLLWGRTDYQRFQTGARTMRGFIPLREGGFTRAPGTIDRGATRNNQPGRLIDFEFARNDSLKLELTDGVMRVWRYGALVEVSGSPGTIYELAIPYDADAIARLTWVQSADVIYFADGQSPIQQLSRFALDNWTIAPATITGGPFRVQNLDEAVTIQASAATGSITLSGVGDPFVAEHVGVLFRLQPVDYSNIPIWTSNTTVAVGDFMRYDDRVYKVEAGTNTGAVAPLHDAGTQLVDKTTGISWSYQSDDTGIVKITGVTDANTAAATVIKTVPKACIDDPTYRWSEGAWSERWGYPACLEIFDQSLVAAATDNEPRGVWVSTLGAFLDFEPGVDADSAFAYTIDGSESQNGINWLRRGRRGIYIGALGEVYRGYSATSGERIGPTTFTTVPEAAEGSIEGRPIAPYGYPILITKDKRRVVELRYSFEEDGGRDLELSSPSAHLGAVGFEQIVWQASPQRHAWIRRSNGELALLLYDPREDVLGWATVPLAGGFVEDMSVTAGLDGGNDVVTLIVRRVIDGATVRRIEELAPVYGVISGSEPIYKAVHFFAARIFEADPQTDTFSLPHLIGEDVFAWTDQGEFGPLTVASDGTVTLDNPVGYAVIGLFDETHEAETLNVQALAPDGDPRGRPERLFPPSGIVLHRTAAGYVQTVERDFGQAARKSAKAQIFDLQIAANLTDAWSGTKSLDVPSGVTDEVSLMFTPRGGAPMTVLALIPDVEEAGA